MINRREAIKRTALLTGAALSTSLIAGVMQGCQPSTAPDWEPAYFSADEMEDVAAMAETILPRTDTPGALDVHVDRYIDLMMSDCTPEEEREKFKAGLDAFRNTCQEELGAAFAELEPDQQLAYLNDINKAALEDRTDPTTNAGYPFFMRFKQLVFTGYFTSEEVGTAVLAYDPIPGEYDACMPLSETDGRVWAL